jgi:hypothetical protein
MAPRAGFEINCKFLSGLARKVQTKRDTPSHTPQCQMGCCRWLRLPAANELNAECRLVARYMSEGHTSGSSCGHNV